MQIETKQYELRQNSAVFCAAERAVSGICAGTHILTQQGDSPVESLKIGDKLVTRSGLSCIRKIERTTKRFRPIRILASSLGHCRPGCDMFTTPSALIHVRDWRAKAIYGVNAANVPAWRLVDGEFITQLPIHEMEIFDLYFDDMQILFADGIQVLSAEA